MKRSKIKLPKVDKRKGVAREAYNVPDETDLQLLQENINKLSKSLLPDGRRKDRKGGYKPISENDLKQIIRSAVRKQWMSCATKLSFMEMGKVPDYDPNSRTRFKIQCNICQGWFKTTDVECDHRKGENSFTTLSEALQWASSILDVGYDDLQRLCVKCHSEKTHSEAAGVSLEEARVDKQAIAIMNDKLDKEWLTDKGIKPGKNAKIRKQQIIDYLRGDKDGHNNS